MFLRDARETSSSKTMTKSDTKSVTSSTGSTIIPFRRRSRKSISIDLAELEKLTIFQLIDRALEQRMVPDAEKSATVAQTSLYVG
jgi:hypothetical protein